MIRSRRLSSLATGSGAAICWHLLSRAANMSPRYSVAIALAVAFFPALRTESVAASHARSGHVAADPDACSLLTQDQVSAAIEAKSLPGEPSGKGKACIWSDDPKHDVGHRRVTMSIGSLIGFNNGKSIPNIKTEPVTGLGDDAYYMIYRADGPLLVVRKGNVVFTVRLLDGLKLKPIGEAQLKARELALAKDAVAKL
ncbi:MAG TPA: hypothetical protein VGQ44_05425 [Gemmatimonadaceae bacterium]|nr:hypothetical protein [Gemmatimonadaceae bacterium]